MPPNGYPVRARGSSRGVSGGFTAERKDSFLPLIILDENKRRTEVPTSLATFDPVAEGQPGVGGAESVPQQPLLEADDWLQHHLVLDLSGGDDDAAVHEVCDGVGHVFFGLGQEGLQTEHLSEEHRKLKHTR